MAARSLLVLVVVMLLHFLSFFLFCQAEKEPVALFMPFAVVVQKPKGKVERERGEGVKIEKNGLGLVYTGVGEVGGYHLIWDKHANAGNPDER